MARKTKIILSIVLALLIISAGTGVLLLFGFPFAQTAPPKTVRQPPYTPHRSVEVPFSTHRALSMEASVQATALLPWGFAFDYRNGFTWVAEPGCEPKIKCPSTVQGVLGQYALSDGTLIQNLNEPNGYSSPLFVAIDQNGNVWFTQPDSNALGEYHPQNQTWNQWPLRKGSLPFDLAFDKNGNLWFTEFDGNAIGFFNTRTHKIVENPVPTAGSNPYGIAIDNSGTFWFTENGPGIDQIGSFTPTLSGTTKITEHSVGVQRPHMITTDQAGNIWYSAGFDGKIGEFTPRTGNSTLFSVYLGACLNPATCTGTHISGIEVDKKGHVWFTDSLSQRVGYLIPSTGQVIARTLNTSNAHPNDGLVIDSSDRVWFTEEFRLTLTMWPAGTIS